MDAEKRTPSRFSIKFNEGDPQAQVVMEILNASGRKKAQYIVTAVIHYLNCKETPHDEITPLMGLLEEMVTKAVSEELSKRGDSPPQERDPIQALPLRRSDVLTTQGTDVDIPAEAQDMIRSILGNFRK